MSFQKGQIRLRSSFRRWALGIVFLVLISSLFLALQAGAAEVLSCSALVERALGPEPAPYSLTLRAGAKTTESLEARGPVYVGVFFELPLVDRSARRRLKQQRREREELLKLIALLQGRRKLLAFKRDLLHYHRERIKKAIEDNAAFLQTKEEEIRLEAELLEISARLRAYGISPEEAATCRW